MRKLVYSSLAAVAMAVGCAKNAPPPPPSHSSLTDLSQPVVVTPPPPVDSIGTAPIGDPVGPVGPVTPPANKKYLVKKGDTLWSIAKANYGDGKQYTKIVSANPGVSPSALKAGQTLMIP